MTFFIKLENGNPVGSPILEDNFRQLFPDANFPKIFIPQDVESYGFGIYEFTQVPEPERYKKVVENIPVKSSDDIYYQNWSIVDMNDSEKEEADNNKKDNVRGMRNYNLSICDWTQIPDAPLTEEKVDEWKVYRQALRDVTDQEGFPWDVKWPEQPAK